ncbi:hypothetical protein SAMN05192534_1593 [Alteribacillus persepolensis]|uniref:Uncharacterized protein n=1 Tax=Alteribacillus persepolensis TaxID=568899 RepID=A0A1G8KNJ2_9BACI|nr:hypothetical protein [Alteribacillus persepolensis]SDI45004.1 hypothetical protein SAMN05192534_1593 [Alteribacillus persepolensis]
MRMKSPVSIGIISFVFVFLGLLLLPGLGETLSQRWFYHPTSTWYVPLLLILSLLIAFMAGAILFVASNFNKFGSLMPWLLIFWPPVFVVVMEGINWNNQIVHLIYSLFAGERIGLENGLTLGCLWHSRNVMIGT